MPDNKPKKKQTKANKNKKENVEKKNDLKKPVIPGNNNNKNNNNTKRSGKKMAMYGMGALATAGGAYALYRKMSQSGISDPDSRVVYVPPAHKLGGFHDYLQNPTQIAKGIAETFAQGLVAMFGSGKPKCAETPLVIRDETEFWGLVPRILSMSSSDFETVKACKTLQGYILTPEHIRRVKELHTQVDVNVHAYVCYHLVSASNDVFEHAKVYNFVETVGYGYVPFPKILVNFVQKLRDNQNDHLDPATFGKYREKIGKMPLPVYKLVESRKVVVLGDRSYKLNNEVLEAIFQTRRELGLLSFYELYSFKELLRPKKSKSNNGQ